MNNHKLYKGVMVNLTITPPHVKERIENAIKYQKENTESKVFLQIFTGDEWRFVGILQPTIERYSLEEFRSRFKTEVELPHPESVDPKELFKVIALYPKQNPSPRGKARGFGRGFG